MFDLPNRRADINGDAVTRLAMFKLIAIEETIQVPARLFGYPRLEALEHAINKRFSDKVIPGIGLCIAFWDWIKVGEDSLQIQSGDSSTKCSFRIVVFAPFDGEAMFGRISGACKSGMFVELGFFDAIVLPKERLPQPSVFDESERVWIWKPSFDGEEQEFYMDVSNEYVFRVRETVYDDQAKLPPTQRKKEDRNPMSIIGALYDDVVHDNQGLGDPLWWYEDGEGGDDNGERQEDDDEQQADVNEEHEGEEYPANGAGNGFHTEDGHDVSDYKDEEMTEWNGDNNQSDVQLPVDFTKTELKLHDS